jgi:hypothetical protein
MKLFLFLSPSKLPPYSPSFGNIADAIASTLAIQMAIAILSTHPALRAPLPGGDFGDYALEISVQS